MIPENVLVPDDDPEDECALCGEPCVGRLCRECHDELTADAAMERCSLFDVSNVVHLLQWQAPRLNLDGF